VKSGKRTIFSTAAAGKIVQGAYITRPMAPLERWPSKPTEAAIYFFLQSPPLGPSNLFVYSAASIKLAATHRAPAESGCDCLFSLHCEQKRLNKMQSRFPIETDGEAIANPFHAHSFQNRIGLFVCFSHCQRHDAHLSSHHHTTQLLKNKNTLQRAVMMTIQKGI
jgi:hypothetical protein